MKIVSMWIISLIGLGTIIIGGASKRKNMDEPTLTVMSYNIRYDNPDDGRNAWSQRKEKVANLIQFYQADLVGLQEVLHRQLTFLEDKLVGYGRIGVGRDDGKQAGEYSPVFYFKERLELLDQGTFWLSETPEKPSVGWDASLERICTWGKFRDRASGDTIYFYNTHFDHRGQQAREESARLLHQRIKRQTDQHLVVLTGDFNSNPKSKAYQSLIQAEDLRDAFVTSKLPSVGPDQSFSGFSVIDSLPGERIDYVFVSPNIRVLRHAIVTSFNDGYFPSDHLPIVAHITW